MISAVVVDDQDLVRHGLRTIVDAQSDLTVVGEAADGAAALDVVASERPDIVLMDIGMPVMDGIAATAAITRDPSLASTKVLIVTTFSNDENIYAALRAGAGGFIGKDAAPDTMVQAIRTLHVGAGLVFPDATRALIAEGAAISRHADAARNGEHRRQIDLLSEREREVVEQVARGLSNDEIAEALFIGKATVKSHLNRCFAKLDLRDRAQMVIFAYEMGLVRPGD